MLDRAPGSHVRRSVSRTFRALAGAVVLAGALLVSAPGGAAPVAAIGPLPACRLADIYTVPSDYDSWSTTLVDWLLRVPEDYVPPDLVPTAEAGISGGGLIRAVAIDDLRALAAAAKKNGTPITVISGYRSYQQQVASFNGWVAYDSYEHAITYSMRPGHSEHQLGLAIDFGQVGGPSSLSYPDWTKTPTGKWMLNNAWKYGWVLSYPWGNGYALWNDKVCFHPEPWHYRYLGREMAAKVHESGLTIREYLWEHYTRVDPATGEAIPTPTPVPTPTPTPSPTPTPTPTPSPTPVPTPTPTPVSTPTPFPAVLFAGTWFGVAPPLLLGAGGVLVLAIGLGLWRAARRR